MIIQDFIPKGRKNRPGTKMTPKFITIHDTANKGKGANADMHAKYLKGNEAASRPASWHFTVDDQKEIQHLPLDEIGWHAGDGSKGQGNTQSIAVEICENVDGDRLKAEDNAAKLVADLLKQLNLPLAAVVQHNHWTGKDCPHVIRSRPSGWDGFIKRVDSHLHPAKPIPTIGSIVNVTVNGEDIGEGYIVAGHTYVPVRAIGEALGLEVGWDAKTKTASLKGGK